MSIFTYTAFANGVADLSVTLIKRKMRNIPDQLNTADLPLQFTRLPTGSEGPMTAEGEGGWPTHLVDLVIVACPIGQSRQPTNHALVMTLMDNLSTTLRAVAANNTFSRSKLSWTIRGEIDFIGDTEYWHIIASITGMG